MPDFTKRSRLPELMDSPVPKDLLFKNLRELEILNRYLGGHKTSIEGISKLITDKDKIYHVVDLGCGGGDTLMAIDQWAKKNKIKIRLTGIDKNRDVIDYLKIKHPEITALIGDLDLFFHKIHKADIVHCSLFCHHFDDDELKNLIKAMYNKVETGLVINDLQRSPAAYYSTKAFTFLFNGS
ncbi:MAG: methyltransferase domain-containing protein [Bacteroidales bacterium]|nr:methyltransferase domain-containing protein [Bacteroidales bacterium]